MNGFLLIDKAPGMTSHDVVSQIKKKLNIKKVGHTGTLDPFASGLLIICLGKATKLASLFSDMDKSYEGIIKFFKHYDTYDVTGQVLYENKISLKNDQLLETAAKFIGQYEQLPPMYSAIKINGKKLYDLARQGKDIDRPTRLVNIKSFQVGELQDDELSFKTSVSKGTYIRSLAVDYAKALDTFAALKTLRRTRVGHYEVKDAKLVEDVTRSDVLTLERYFSTYPKLKLSDYLIHLVKNGVYLDERQISTDKNFVVVNQLDEMIAYYEVVGKHKYKPVLIF